MPIKRCHFFQVNIPIVPILPKAFDGDDLSQINRLNRAASNPPVSPHRINNFVYESSPNRLIFDFGEAAADPVSCLSKLRKCFSPLSFLPAFPCKIFFKYWVEAFILK